MRGLKERGDSLVGNKQTERMKRKRHNRKQQLYYNQRGCCAYCGNRFMLDVLTFDHILRVKDGGKDHIDNMVLACIPCNRYRESLPGSNMKREAMRHRQLIDMRSV